MLPCPSPRSIRAFLMGSPSVRGSQLFVLPALRQRDPGGLIHARVTRKALGDCRRIPVRLNPGTAASYRHPRGPAARAYSRRPTPRDRRTRPKAPDADLRLCPEPPQTHGGTSNGASRPGADRRPARATRPLRKGIERLILCLLRAVHRKAYSVPITTRLTGKRCCGSIANRTY
jgi:hypothetical protein